MSKNAKKTAPVVGHRDGQNEPSNHEVFQFENSLPQKSQKYNGFVAPALPHGKDNPIPSRTLVGILRLKNGRELTRLIEHERRTGVPICASVDPRNPGYYLAGSSDELEAYITALDRRIKSVSLTRSYCARTLRGMKG